MWRDEGWFERSSGLRVRHLGWQNGLRGALTADPQCIETDGAQCNAGREDAPMGRVVGRHVELDDRGRIVLCGLVNSLAESLESSMQEAGGP